MRRRTAALRWRLRDPKSIRGHDQFKFVRWCTLAFDACKVSMLLTIKKRRHSKQTRCQIRLYECLCGFRRIELLHSFKLAGLNYLQFYLHTVKRMTSEF